ncbi:MAG: MoaD family protein [Gammaproteobacteria bacterium]|nr:MoaD family protein [Gammaproteobacteria bacterium]
MEQVRQVMRYHHYAYRTEKTYSDWILRYIKFHGGKTHPKNMGKNEIEAFLSHLATQGKVSASTQRQALNAFVSGMVISAKNEKRSTPRMKIKVKGYFNFKKAFRNLGISEIEMAGGTLIGLFDDLSDRFGEEFTDLIYDSRTKRVRGDIRILLNGRHIVHLPKGLDTELKEGDEIALFPPVAGG